MTAEQLKSNAAQQLSLVSQWSEYEYYRQFAELSDRLSLADYKHILRFISEHYDDYQALRHDDIEHSTKVFSRVDHPSLPRKVTIISEQLTDPDRIAFHAIIETKSKIADGGKYLPNAMVDLRLVKYGSHSVGKVSLVAISSEPSEEVGRQWIGMRRIKGCTEELLEEQGNPVLRSAEISYANRRHTAVQRYFYVPEGNPKQRLKAHPADTYEREMNRCSISRNRLVGTYPNAILYTRLAIADLFQVLADGQKADTKNSGGRTLYDEQVRSIYHFVQQNFYSIASALNDGVGAIHASGFVHTDIKPENILVYVTRGADGGDIIKFTIMDFELAMPMGTPYLHGSPEYLPPELHIANRFQRLSYVTPDVTRTLVYRLCTDNGQRPGELINQNKFNNTKQVAANPAQDMFSLGMVLAVIYLLKMPRAAYIEQYGKHPLLSLLLQFRPELRPTAAENSRLIKVIQAKANPNIDQQCGAEQTRATLLRWRDIAAKKEAAKQEAANVEANKRQAEQDHITVASNEANDVIYDNKYRSVQQA